MRSFNEHQVYGQLARAPEQFETPKGKKAAVLTIGTEETWNDQTGKERRKVDWHRAVVYGKDAEHCIAYLKRYDWVWVKGKVSTRMTQRDGHDYPITEIHVQVVRFIQSPSDSPAVSEEETPFA